MQIFSQAKLTKTFFYEKVSMHDGIGILCQCRCGGTDVAVSESGFKRKRTCEGPLFPTDVGGESAAHA